MEVARLHSSSLINKQISYHIPTEIGAYSSHYGALFLSVAIFVYGLAILGYPTSVVASALKRMHHKTQQPVWANLVPVVRDLLPAFCSCSSSRHTQALAPAWLVLVASAAGFTLRRPP